MSVAHVRWLAAVVLVSAAVGCEDTKSSGGEVASVAPTATTPPAPTGPAPTATAKPDATGAARHEVAGYSIEVPNAWKQTSDKPTEQRFENPAGKGAMPPVCSLEERELPPGQTDPFVLEEAENPTVTDHEKKAMKVGDEEAMDHLFAVEPPGGSAMRVWVRLVDLGGGKRLALQCLGDATQFEQLKSDAFTKIFASLQPKKS